MSDGWYTIWICEVVPVLGFVDEFVVARLVVDWF